MNNNLELSLIVLCYRAEENIIPFSEKLKREIQKSTDSFEILLIGNYLDGSADKTPGIIKEIADRDPVFKAISKKKEGMMGWDVRVGLEAAKGDFIGFIDGDGQFPISSITPCFQKIREGEYGMVKTYRSSRKDGMQRIIMSLGYNIISKILFPEVKARDLNSKPKIFKREVYEVLDLTSDDWFIDAEIMIKISRLGIKYHETPIQFKKLYGRSSFVNIGTILEFVRNLISYRFRRN